MRLFALSLHLYSPKAYNFIREKFSCHLPHVSTLRKWLSNSYDLSESGIIKESVERVTSLVNKMKADGMELLTTLAFDEMSIRQHVQWLEHEKRFSGLITYGIRDVHEEIPVAKHALVFMLNGINLEFSIPVAFYFIVGLYANEKSKLIVDIITTFTNIGVRIANITFDGLVTNIATCKRLGASFEFREPKPYFINPVDRSRVYIILDTCHMLKLLRNLIADLTEDDILLDGDGREISWCYFKRLENYRTKNDFITHKPNKTHINFGDRKMKVIVLYSLFFICEW